MNVFYSVKQFRPKFIKTIAIIFLAFPISFIFFVGIIFDIPFGALLKLFVSPWFILFSIFGIFTGYGMLEMKRWTWWIYLFLLSGIVFYSFWLLIHFGETHHKITALTVEFLILLMLSYSIRREFITPYIIPKIKWWEKDSDQFFYCKAKIKSEFKEELIGDLMDISFKGCFIKIKERILLNDEVEILINAFGQGLTCRGVVVWHAESTVTHPRGIGIRFDGFDKRTKRVLKMFIHRLVRIHEIKKSGLKIINVKDFFRNLNILQSLDARVISPPKIIKKKKMSLNFRKKLQKNENN